jgi:L-iditol 2-dehydrogenase
MGVLHLLLAKQLGASVVVADMVPARLERARCLGADGVVDVREGTLREGVEKATAGAGADVVIVGPGSLQAMNDGLDAAGPASTVVFFTCSKPGKTLEIDPSRLYFDEISIVPSYSCGPADTRAALEYIRSGVVSADDLVTHRFPLEKAAEALAMAARTDEALKTVVVID